MRVLPIMSVVVTGLGLLGIASEVEASKLTAPAFKSPAYALRVQPQGKTPTLIAQAPEGHHFNLQAPSQMEINQAKRKPLTESTEQELRFALSEFSRVDGSATVIAYLCDDAKTFCEKRPQSVQWKKAGVLEVLDQVLPPSSGTAPTAAVAVPQPKKDPHGFILNQADVALGLAREKELPLLIDFYGIWCPPCNELDEHVFNQAKFKKASNRFVKLKLDADSDASWALKSKYRVGGYPTVIFATADGDEILRVVGSRPLAAFLKEMDRAWELRLESESLRLKKAESGDLAARERQGLIELERKDFAAAAKSLELSQRYREQFFEAKLGLIDEKGGSKQEAELATVLQQAIEAFPRSPLSVDRRLRLAELQKNDVEAFRAGVRGAIEAANALIADPRALSQSGELSTADLWVSIAQSYEKLDEAAQSKKAWKRAVATYRQRMRNPKERGSSLELAYCLWKSGDLAGAEKIYTRFEKAYPKEFTFFYAHASILAELKQWEKAQPLAQTAYDQSYGDNRLRAGQLLARVFQEQGRKLKALEAVKATLASVKIPEDPSIRTHRYVKKLREMEKQLKD